MQDELFAWLSVTVNIVVFDPIFKQENNEGLIVRDEIAQLSFDELLIAPAVVEAIGELFRKMVTFRQIALGRTVS